MGSGRFTSDSWVSYASTRSYDTKTTADIFTNTVVAPELKPLDIGLRESRDSADNPASTAIIIAQDVSGSMGMISDTMVRKGIPTLLEEIYTRKPVSDPHVLCMAIGDIECDRSPVQVTQFEADIRIVKQLELFHLEAGGGGNDHESYSMAWYIAAHHTVTDCFEKRGKKGYLFTIGDEMPTRKMTAENIKRHLGTGPEADISDEELLTLASRKWEIFHIIVEQGSFARSRGAAVKDRWVKVLGQRVLSLPDHTKLAEVIVSAIQINEGANKEDVIASWDGSTAVAVKAATENLTPGTPSGADAGRVHL